MILCPFLRIFVFVSVDTCAIALLLEVLYKLMGKAKVIFLTLHCIVMSILGSVQHFRLHVNHLLLLYVWCLCILEIHFLCMTENPSSITPGQFIELQSFAISIDGFLFYMVS